MLAVRSVTLLPNAWETLASKLLFGVVCGWAGVGLRLTHSQSPARR